MLYADRRFCCLYFMIIRFAKGNYVLATSGRHAARRAITVGMTQTDNRNICKAPSAKMNIYTHPQRRVQVNEDKEYRDQFFHVAVDFESCFKGNPARKSCL